MLLVTNYLSKLIIIKVHVKYFFNFIATNERIMSERIIPVETGNPVEIFGVNDKNLNLIRKIFPKLKLIARDNQLKVMGEESEIEYFEGRFRLILIHLERFGRLTETDILQICDENEQLVYDVKTEGEDFILHGRNGVPVKARTPNQRKMVKSSTQNGLIFAIGPAGTGKTYTAVALAVRALKNREVKRIILTRPAVEAGENLGFLPGDLRDKLDPYLQPLYDALRDMIPSQKLLASFDDNTIEIAPLAFMRGRTLDNAFVILDEAQNATIPQMKMFLTRMGKTAKFIVTGDLTQVDLPRNQPTGLLHAASILKGIDGIDFIYLNEKDVVRHHLVTEIINAYGKNENVNLNQKENGEKK